MIETAQFSQPPPNLSAPPPNLQMPPPNMSMPPPSLGTPTNPQARPPFLNNNQNRVTPQTHFYKPFPGIFPRGPTGGPMTQDDFDGKRLRKSVMRKTVDYNAAIIKVLQNRVWQRDFRDRQALQPDPMYIPDLLPPPSYPENPINAVTTKFVKTATNKMRCPIFTLAWTPEGRRLVTGASSGEFTLWNGLTFNFETILQAHDTPVRTMVWSHNDNWMVTGDHGGFVKYWQSNMNNVKMFQAHKEPLRGISFSPTDSKFVSCSDDGTLRIWDFMRHQEEKVLRGHGADVKCVHWHPQKGLIVSGSKDNQQPIKLWDPKSGQALATLHAHKSTVMDLKWNDNGNWLITASRDHLLKLFDLRNMNQELQIFRGHKKEASSVAWHPNHEGLFCSGGSDGSILFWNVGTDKEVGAIDTAHDSIVWTLAWHPLGHILCSGSNDHTIKFWTRNRPGDQMRDKYNLNTLPAGLAGLDEIDLDEPSVIPGMGPEDKIEIADSLPSFLGGSGGAIPGLDLDTSLIAGLTDDKSKAKKVPYAKPIPRNFQAQWNDTGKNDDDEEATQNEIKEAITQIVENTPGVVPLQNITPTGIILYGKLVPVKPGSKLQAAIAEGPEALEKYIAKGEIEELRDVLPQDGKERTRSRITIGKDGSPIVKKSRFSDAVDPKPTFIYGDRYNNAPIIEQPDFKLQNKNFFNTPQNKPNNQVNISNNSHNNSGNDRNLPPLFDNPNQGDNMDNNRSRDEPMNHNDFKSNNGGGDNNMSSRFDFDNNSQQFGQKSPANTRWGSNNQQSPQPWQNQQQTPPHNFNMKFPPNFRPPMNFPNQGPPPGGPSPGGHNQNQNPQNHGPPNGSPQNRMMGPPPGGNWMRMDFRPRGGPPFNMNQGPPPRGMMRGGPPMRGGPGGPGPRLFGPRPGIQRGRNRF